MQDTFRGIRTLRFLWHEQSGLCTVCNTKITRITSGAFTTAFPACWVVRKAPRTAFYFIRSAMTGFTTSAFLSRNRVSPKEAFERLELCEGKLSCTVLRGLDGSNPVRLLGFNSMTVSRSQGAGNNFYLSPIGVPVRRSSGRGHIRFNAIPSRQGVSSGTFWTSWMLYVAFVSDIVRVGPHG
jgi:hypothetical protein